MTTRGRQSGVMWIDLYASFSPLKGPWLAGRNIYDRRFFGKVCVYWFLQPQCSEHVAKLEKQLIKGTNFHKKLNHTREKTRHNATRIVVKLKLVFLSTTTLLIFPPGPQILFSSPFQLWSARSWPRANLKIISPGKMGATFTKTATFSINSLENGALFSGLLTTRKPIDCWPFQRISTVLSRQKNCYLYIQNRTYKTNN